MLSGLVFPFYFLFIFLIFKKEFFFDVDRF